MGCKIDYQTYQQIKKHLKACSDEKPVAKNFGISESTAHRIRVSSSFKDYRAKIERYMANKTAKNNQIKPFEIYSDLDREIIGSMRMVAIVSFVATILFLALFILLIGGTLNVF